MITTLYNNKFILMCQNSVYISKEWWYLSNQKQFKIKKLNWKRARVLSSVKIAKGGLNFYFSFSFYFYFIFIFDLFSILELGLGLEWQRSRCHTAGHIRWHGHKSHDIWKDVEGSERMMLYNVWNTCWP